MNIEDPSEDDAILRKICTSGAWDKEKERDELAKAHQATSGEGSPSSFVMSRIPCSHSHWKVEMTDPPHIHQQSIYMKMRSHQKGEFVSPIMNRCRKRWMKMASV